MSHCDMCDVDIRGTYAKCPLCKNPIVVKGREEDNVFPKIKTIYESYKKLFLGLLWISVLVSVSSVVTNIFVTPHVLWSSFVILGLLSAWLIIYIYVDRRSSLPKYIFVQSIVLTFLTLAWDYATGWHNWSIDFVLPIVYAIDLVTTFVIGKILNIKPNEVMFYLIFAIILGFIPLVLISFDLLTITIPSLVCILIANTFLVMMVIFEGKNMLEELKRRLHI